MNLGHTFIDLLKIDIEGAEFDTLSTFLRAHKSSGSLPIGQLQLELHAWDDYGNFPFFHDWWVSLEEGGLRPFWTEANLVYVNYNEGGKPRLAEVGNSHMKNSTLVTDRKHRSTRLSIFMGIIRLCTSQQKKRLRKLLVVAWHCIYIWNIDTRLIGCKK